jgi:hypothetical protein
MHDARFSSSSSTKYVADDDLFIIQFLPIYLADSAKA